MDILGNLNIGEYMGGVYTVILVIILFVLAIILIWIILFIRKFKHKIRIKEVVQGRKIIHDDKFREYADKDGNEWYHLLKKRVKIPRPPEECIEISKKGRKVVEVYKLSTGEYIYCKDLCEPIPTELQNIGNKKDKETKINQWLKTHKAVEAYQPLTTNQRVIFINQMKKAQMKRTTRLLDSLPQIAGIAALVIIVVSLMIFYGDMAKPLLSAMDKYNQNAVMQKETAEILKEIKYDIQIIKADKGKENEAPN